jgi:hypothetical protein
LLRQATHVWSSQTGLSRSGQSLLRQQAPVTHAPSQQTWPALHCPAFRQATQWKFWHTGVGALHAASLQQSPCRHWLRQQTCPTPHWSSVQQAAQRWKPQNGRRGLVHWSSVQQMPRKHSPSQQIANSPSHVLRWLSSQHCLQTPSQSRGVSGGQAAQTPAWQTVPRQQAASGPHAPPAGTQVGQQAVPRPQSWLLSEPSGMIV